MATNKVSIDDVISALRDSGAAQEVVKSTLEKLHQVVQEEQADKQKTPKSKNQFVAVTIDDTGRLAGLDIPIFIAQIEEEAPPQAFIDRIQAAANAYHGSRKGRKKPVKTKGEAISCIPRKFWKTENEMEKTLIKTRETIPLLVVDGSLKS